MEFEDVVRARRMVRRYDPTRDVPRGTVTALLDLATRAPSAGASQGWHFLVLDAVEDRAAYWRLTARPGTPDAWAAGMATAPVVVVVLSDPAAYAARYAAPDKANSPLAVGPADGDVPAWPVPYWDVDAGMAALLLLLGATDAGLGACFAGVPPDRWDVVREAFGVPAQWRPVGIVTLGYPAPDATSRRRRPRRSAAETVNWGRYAPGPEPAPPSSGSPSSSPAPSGPASSG